MTHFRSLLLARRWRALALVVAALAVRLVVPVGMMPGHGPGGPTLIVCPGQMAMTGAAMSGMSADAMPGMAMPATKSGGHDSLPGDAPCAFTGLLAAALDTAALPVLPPLPKPVAIAVVAAPVAGAVRSPRLRPPLRGPPPAIA